MLYPFKPESTKRSFWPVVVSSMLLLSLLFLLFACNGPLLFVSTLTNELIIIIIIIIREVYNGFITCPSLLEAAGISVPVRNIGDFILRFHEINVLVFAVP
jgi:hypothetical protein